MQTSLTVRRLSSKSRTVLMLLLINRYLELTGWLRQTRLSVVHAVTRHLKQRPISKLKHQLTYLTFVSRQLQPSRNILQKTTFSLFPAINENKRQTELATLVNEMRIIGHPSFEYIGPMKFEKSKAQNVWTLIIMQRFLEKNL